jgi:hypothetical protein
MRRIIIAALVTAAAVLTTSVLVSSTASGASKRRLPNVVGMNHQAAQDRLQAAGFYMLAERDCTGRGRALLWDRNWKVRRQSPRGGRRVSTERTITLCSVKYTD